MVICEGGGIKGINTVVYELCHGKMRLKIFVVVSVENRSQNLKSIIGRDFDPIIDFDSILLCCLHRLYSIIGVVPKDRLVGPHPPILLLV